MLCNERENMLLMRWWGRPQWKSKTLYPRAAPKSLMWIFSIIDTFIRLHEEKARKEIDYSVHLEFSTMSFIINSLGEEKRHKRDGRAESIMMWLEPTKPLNIDFIFDIWQCLSISKIDFRSASCSQNIISLSSAIHNTLSLSLLLAAQRDVHSSSQLVHFCDECKCHRRFR